MYNVHTIVKIIVSGCSLIVIFSEDCFNINNNTKKFEIINYSLRRFYKLQRWQVLDLDFLMSPLSQNCDKSFYRIAVWPF